MTRGPGRACRDSTTFPVVNLSLHATQASFPTPTGTQPLTPETVFLLCNNTAAIGWIVLILTPRFPIFARLLIPVVLCGFLALVYLYLVVSDFGGAEGSFTSLAGVIQFFANPKVVLAGWIHYLVFDLFIGCWEVRDSRRHGIHHLLVVPSLILTFLLGPIGLLTYLVTRLIQTRSLNLACEPSSKEESSGIPDAQ